MLWIPVGFAHGFLTLSDSADVIYACTDYYAPDSERTIAWNDPGLAIAWPLDSGARPLVSGKDAKGAAFKAADLFP
jgi:dTDP-4-dehydrorhamnose 3,5-epimerase